MKRIRPVLILLTLIILPSLACGFLTTATPDLASEPAVQEVATQVVTQVVTQVEAPVVAPTFPTDNFEPLANEEAILVELYKRVNPAVVNITVFAESAQETLSPFTQGSGFVYDSAGHIVTNAHVVHGAIRIEVNFYDGRTRPAEVVGEDLYSDLAVIQVEDLPEGIIPLPLGNMDELAVGQTAIAIGNPFGFSGTLTRGIISALGRTIEGLTIFNIPQTIQTDAAINPGNSGGPLLNLRGEVIGVNAQIRTGDASRSNSGVGFAIPVSIVARVVPDLIENGTYEWTWLGIQGRSVDYRLAQAMDLPDDRGAYVSIVIERGPSAKAGLRGSEGTTTVDGITYEVGGDVIVAIDGQPVGSFDDLLVYIALETRPGQEVILTVLRDGDAIEIPLTLEARPEDLR
jgi:2-alkenal reductase